MLSICQFVFFTLASYILSNLQRTAGVTAQCPARTYVPILQYNSGGRNFPFILHYAPTARCYIWSPTLGYFLMSPLKKTALAAILVFNLEMTPAVSFLWHEMSSLFWIKWGLALLNPNRLWKDLSILNLYQFCWTATPEKPEKDPADHMTVLKTKVYKEI